MPTDETTYDNLPWTATPSKSHLVIGGCGCWWIETAPPSFDPTQSPRVCSKCPSTHHAAVAPSPQGLAMVHVTYITDPAHTEAAYELLHRKTR